MLITTAIYGIFAGLFLGGVIIGYFVSQQQTSELDLQIQELTARIEEKNAEIAALEKQVGVLQDDIMDLNKKIEHYSMPLLLEYEKAGGIAGISEKLEIDEFGNAVMTSLNEEEEAKLSQESITTIKDMLLRNEFFGISPNSFEPALGNADFFSYSLRVTMGGLTKQVSWVDSWAASQEIPDNLITIQAEITAIYNSVRDDMNSNSGIRNGLRLTLKSDKEVYSAEDIVRITAMIENVGPNTINYTSPTPCDLNIRIFVDDGSQNRDITYADRDPQPCIQVTEERTIKPGDLIVQELLWDLMVKFENTERSLSAGSYEIRAIFPFANSEETLVETSITIQIRG